MEKPIKFFKNNVMKNAIKKFESKQEEQGDLWKEIDMPTLRELTKEHMNKWLERKGTINEPFDLYDIINYCCMLCYRIYKGDGRQTWENRGKEELK